MTESDNVPQVANESEESAVASSLSNLVQAVGQKPAAPVKAGAKPAPAKPAATGKAGANTAAAIAAQKAQVNPGAPKPIAGPLVTVVTRNEFYRDGFRNLIIIAMLEAVVIIGLILALIVYINNSKPDDRYFATTADGRIMQLQPLNVPNMETPALLSWVATAVTDTLSFSYLTYQKDLQNSSRHFTKAGWESFTGAMQRAHILDSVQALQQIVSATPRTSPILKQSGVLNGKYRWVLELPITVKYQSVKESRQDQLTLTLVVERVPSLENPVGVGIAQWIAVQK